MLKPKRLLAVLLSALVVVELLTTAITNTLADDAEENRTVVKSLLDFTGTQVAEGIGDDAWPEGITKMSADDKFAGVWR